MKKPTVVFTEPIHPIGMDMLADVAECVVAPEPTLAAMLELAPRADAFVVRTAPITRAVLTAATNLKVVGKHGVGVDNIDIAAATDLGIPVFSTPGTNAEAVAEMALALMLALARRLPAAHAYVRDNRFVQGRKEYLAVEMEGKTLGLVGVGRIGTLLAKMCCGAFGMRVMAYDPYVAVPPALPVGQIEMVTDLYDLLREADFISTHVPLTEQTRGIISTAELKAMKSSAYIVNTARGGIVDEAALAEALAAGTIAGAGMDVFDLEPTPDPNNPLFKLDNIILSPHIGGQTAESMQKMARAVAQGTLDGLKGLRPANLLNPAIYDATK